MSGRWIFGNEDETPSPADVDEYEAALKAGGVPYVFHRYDNAGHAFQSFNSEDYYRHDISEDAWTKVCAFKRELGLDALKVRLSFLDESLTGFFGISGTL